MYTRCYAAQSTARTFAACASDRACSTRASRGVRAAPRRSARQPWTAVHMHAPGRTYAPKVLGGILCNNAPSAACVVLEPLGGSVLTYAVWQGQHGVVREPQGGSALPTRTYGYARCDAAQSTARAGAACASYRACSARACRGVRAAPRRSEKAAIDCCAHAGVTAYAPKLVTGASCKTCTLTRLRGPRTTTRFGAYIGTTAGTVPRVVVEPLTPSPGSLTPHAHLCCMEAK